MKIQPTLKQYLQSTTLSNLAMQIAAPVLLIVFAVTFQINSLSESRAQQLARTSLNAQDIGATLASSIAGAFQNVDLTLLAASDYIRDRKSLDGFDVAKFSSSVDVLQRRVPSLLMVRATDDVGTAFHTALYQENINVGDRQYFQQLKDNPGAGMVISEPLLGRSSHHWVIICARRFNLSNGKFGGIIYASIELDGFVERVTGRQLLLSSNDAFSIRDDQSHILVRYAHSKPDMSIVGQKVTSPNLTEFDASGATSVSYTAKSAIDKVERVFYAQRIKDQPMSLVVGLSTEDALTIWRAEVRKKWIITAVFILVVVVSFFLLHFEQFRKLKVIRDLEAARDDLSELDRFNEAIFLNSPLPKGVYTADGECIKVNEAMAALVGTTREKLQAENFYNIPNWKSSGMLDACLESMKNNTRVVIEVNFTTSYGKQLTAQCHVQCVEQTQGQVVLIQFADQTEIKNANALLANILKSMNEGVHLINYDGTVLTGNDASVAMLGWTTDDIKGRQAHSTFHHHHADLTPFQLEDCAVHATLRDGVPRHVAEDIYWRKDGTSFPVEYTATPIMSPDGKGNMVTVVFRDITERKRMEEELRRQASHDALTGLPNRRLLMDRLCQTIHINRRQNTYGALLFLDLNKFKLVNDTHGHEVGDQLLIEVSKRLKQVTRESDTVARLGGDEFVVLLFGLDADGDLAKRYVEIVIEKIRRRLSLEYSIGGHSLHCTASIGSKLFRDDLESDDILRDADSAMYQMKKLRV